MGSETLLEISDGEVLMNGKWKVENGKIKNFYGAIPPFKRGFILSR